jgi:hypothetical protein
MKGNPWVSRTRQARPPTLVDRRAAGNTLAVVSRIELTAPLGTWRTGPRRPLHGAPTHHACQPFRRSLAVVSDGPVALRPPGSGSAAEGVA